jgi:hypothetical protein
LKPARQHEFGVAVHTNLIQVAAQRSIDARCQDLAAIDQAAQILPALLGLGADTFTGEPN